MRSDAYYRDKAIVERNAARLSCETGVQDFGALMHMLESAYRIAKGIVSNLEGGANFDLDRRKGETVPDIVRQMRARSAYDDGVDLSYWADRIECAYFGGRL